MTLIKLDIVSWWFTTSLSFPNNDLLQRKNGKLQNEVSKWDSTVEVSIFYIQSMVNVSKVRDKM